MKTRYFIAKVDTIQSLQTCVATGRWACRDRTLGQQTSQLLTEAYSDGRVVVIYSVSGSHGWHGWAEIGSVPGVRTQVTKGPRQTSDSSDRETATQAQIKVIEETKAISGSSQIDSLPGAQTLVTEEPQAACRSLELSNMSICRQNVKKDSFPMSSTQISNQGLASASELCNLSADVQMHSSPSGTAEKKVLLSSELLEKYHKGQTDNSNPRDIDTKYVQNFQEWSYFQVQWKVSYVKEFGEQCLSFKLTEDGRFRSVDGTPVNKCRNWQEVDESVGQEMCTMMEGYLRELQERRDQKERKQVEKVAPAFYKETNVETSEDTWKHLINKVETTLGKVLIACPFGSQRYNLSVPESDVDMFIVYQAKTFQILGFNAPKQSIKAKTCQILGFNAPNQSIKSSEQEELDYSILEVFRFCELLVSGDARCVETLFLDARSVVHVAPEWEELAKHRRLFLHRDCLNKYLRDAQGSKGTRYLQKWCNDNRQVEILPPKLCKMLYVIVRLLQNARDIVDGESLKVYREEGSEEREQLMTIRHNNIPVNKAWDIIHRLESDIQQKMSSVPEKTDAMDSMVEKWLLQLRLASFLETHGT